MAEEKDRSWVQKILPGWFREDDEPVDEESLLEQGRPALAAVPREGHIHPSSPGISRTTSNIAGRLAALKAALEFDGDVASRLDEIGSSQELLLYVYDVLVFKFDKLREIGLLSSKSAQAVDLISRKLEAVLVRQNGEQREEEPSPADLKAENEALQKRFEALQAKYLQSGVITDREIEIERECNYLKSRVRELDTFLRIAQKKINVLTATAEMVRSLQAKNSLLALKAEHQSRLLKSLVAGQPENKELLQTIEKLSSENGQMRVQLERQEEVLEQFQSYRRTDPEMGELLKGLIDENAGLVAELQVKQDHLESLSVDRTKESVLQNVERLQDENIELKHRIEANESISQMVAAYEAKGEESGDFVETLQNENHRLKQLLVAKKEQIKVLSNHPSNRPLVQAIVRLKNDQRQLRRESDQKARYISQLLGERKELQGKVRQYAALAKESKRLRAELQFNKKLVGSYRKVEYQYELLKKKFSKVRNKFEIARNENAALNKKLDRLTAEYSLLVQEYENLFGKI